MSADLLEQVATHISPYLPISPHISLLEQVATLTARLQHFESGGGPLPPLATFSISGQSALAPCFAATGAAIATPSDLALHRCHALQQKLNAMRASIRASATGDDCAAAGEAAAAGADSPSGGRESDGSTEEEASAEDLEYKA